MVASLASFNTMNCSNLRGTDSKDPYFRQLPHMYMLSYQGSESSTSEGILKVKENKKKSSTEHKKLQHFSY
jgi:hypothetical protein